MWFDFKLITVIDQIKFDHTPWYRTFNLTTAAPTKSVIQQWYLLDSISYQIYSTLIGHRRCHQRNLEYCAMLLWHHRASWHDTMVPHGRMAWENRCQTSHSHDNRALQVTIETQPIWPVFIHHTFIYHNTSSKWSGLIINRVK